MSLPLVSFISLILMATGLAVFVISLRKAARIMKLSREIVHQVAHSAASLDHALATLQAERDTFRDESKRLEARLRDSDRARKDISRSISLVERVKGEIQDDVRELQKQANAHRLTEVVRRNLASMPSAPVETVQPATAEPGEVTAPRPSFQASFALHLAAARAASGIGKQDEEPLQTVSRAKLPVFVNRVVRSSDIAATAF